MPKALFLVKWDNMLGSVIDQKFPEKNDIPIEKLTQYLGTIQILTNSSSLQVRETTHISLIQLLDEKNKKIPDFLILTLDESEAIKVDFFQLKLKYISESLSSLKEVHRKRKFLEFAHQIFNPSVQKIVFLGFPNSGKTSTKKFLFENINQDNILNTSLVPTEGFETNQYQFLDLNISLFDTSGQELDRWFEETEMIFESSELIIFFFSISNWIENKEIVKKRILQLQGKDSTIKRTNLSKLDIVLFCHKADLLSESNISIKQEITIFAQDCHIPIFFTSIKDGGNEGLILGMQIIIEKFSMVYSLLSTFSQHLVSGSKFRPLYIFDSDFRIVINYDGIHSFNQNQIAIRALFSNNLTQYEKNMNIKARYMITQSQDKLNSFIAFNINPIFPNFSYLIIMSTNTCPIDGIVEKYEELLLSLRGTLIDNTK